jgi:hypothetical protein
MRNGARVIEVPIVFEKRKRGNSKLSFQDQTEFLTNLSRLFLKGFAAKRFLWTFSHSVV